MFNSGPVKHCFLLLLNCQGLHTFVCFNVMQPAILDCFLLIKEKLSLTPCLHLLYSESSTIAAAAVLRQCLHWICSAAALLYTQKCFDSAYSPMHNQYSYKSRFVV